MTLSQRITIPNNIFPQAVDDEIIILDMKSENYYGLDEVAASMWRAIEEKNTLEEAYMLLLQEYDVEPIVLQKDLMEFVSALENSGLVIR